VVLLSTSTLASQKYLGKNWKRLHSIVWLAVPFIFLHSNLAAAAYLGVPSQIGFFATTTIIVFVFIEAIVYFLKKRSFPIDWRHQVLIILGILISFLIGGPPLNVFKSQDTSNQIITSSQLSKHNSSESCYISYKENVYDLTSFITQHPGGKEIETKCGQVVDTFDHPGGSFDSNKMQDALKSLYIGKLEN
jgi:hypothetical protein